MVSGRCKFPRWRKTHNDKNKKLWLTVILTALTLLTRAISIDRTDIFRTGELPRVHLGFIRLWFYQ